jgi:hypothetical protein
LKALLVILFKVEFKSAMLSDEDLKWNYKLYSLSRRLGIHPVNLLGSDGFQGKRAVWHRFVYPVGSVVALVLGFSSTIRELKSFSGGNPGLDLILISSLYSFAFLISPVLAYFLYKKDPELTLKILKELRQIPGTHFLLSNHGKFNLLITRY